MIWQKWKSLWNPELYHGWTKNDRFFEGWYYKLVSPDEKYAMAIIVGVSKNEAEGGHSFIQILDGKSCTSRYFRFENSEFNMAKREFHLELGPNVFTMDRIFLDLEGIQGELELLDLIPWPSSLLAPGIMGWYSFVPFMQCYHGVISMDHKINGSLRIRKELANFSGGYGYSEKDWGVSFPKCWIWLQCNHFDSDERISCCASVAHIPWLGSYFIGFIAGLYFRGKVYRFASYTKAKMKADIQDLSISLSFRDGSRIMELSATKKQGARLKSPIQGKMVGKIEESLGSLVQLKYWEDNVLIINHKGRNAGLEVAGDVEVLLTQKWRI